MQAVDKICSLILSVFALLMLHKTFYTLLGLLCRPKKYAPTDRTFSYAVVIAARNEEKVIGNLIESIRRQNYQLPPEIFVVADNCTDGTAELCRSLGCRVYERFDSERARKGYALEFLFDNIERDFGIACFDGYFVFDADNLLAPDFISQMNRAFAAGSRIVTGYRNTKNFDTNVISSAYGIHFCRNSAIFHRPRSVLGVGTHLTGTGYLISSALLAGGWHYTTFTEDDQITLSMSGRGVRVAYCEAAEFFDEQPVDFATVFRQRVRWARGRLVNFFRYGGRAFSGIFRLRSFTCYDMFTHYFPYGLFTWLIGLVYPALVFIYGFIVPGSYNYSHMLFNVFSILGAQYSSALLTGSLTVLRERRHIHCSAPKLIFYVLTYPWFPMISIPVYIVAIFSRVRWTPIIHSDSRKIEDLERKG